MFAGKSSNVLREIVAQMRELAALLQKNVAAREAVQERMPDFKSQHEKFAKEREERERQMAQMRKQADERHAEQIAAHAAWLAAMDRQTAVLTRIAERLDRLSP